MRLSTKYYRDCVSPNSEEKLSRRNYLLTNSTTHSILQLIQIYSQRDTTLYIPDFYCGETSNTICKNWSGKIIFYSFDPKKPAKGILNSLQGALKHDILIVPILWRVDPALREIFKQNRIRLIIDAAEYFRFYTTTAHPVVFSDYKYLNLRVGGSCIITDYSDIKLDLGKLELILIADLRYFFACLYRRCNLKKLQEPRINTSGLIRKTNYFKHSKYSLYRYNKAIGQFDFQWWQARSKRNKFLDILVVKPNLFDVQILKLFTDMRRQEEIPISLPLWFKNQDINDKFIKLCNKYSFEVFYWPDLSVQNANRAAASVLCMSLVGKEKPKELEDFRIILNQL